jgi:hypothetical protein
LADPPLPDQDTPPPTLGYARPEIQPVARGLAPLAGFLAFGTVVGGIFCLFFAAYGGSWSNIEFGCAIAILVAIPLACGLGLHQSKRWRLVGTGLLIGLGIAAMVEGVCFLANMK